MNNKTWLDKEKLLEIAQSDGEVTLTSDQVELLFEENAKLVSQLEWTLNALTRMSANEPVFNLDEVISGAVKLLFELRGGTQ